MWGSQRSPRAGSNLNTRFSTTMPRTSLCRAASPGKRLARRPAALPRVTMLRRLQRALAARLPRPLGQPLVDEREAGDLAGHRQVALALDRSDQLQCAPRRSGVEEAHTEDLHVPLAQLLRVEDLVLRALHVVPQQVDVVVSLLGHERIDRPAGHLDRALSQVEI